MACSVAPIGVRLQQTELKAVVINGLSTISLNKCLATGDVVSIATSPARSPIHQLGLNGSISESKSACSCSRVEMQHHAHSQIGQGLRWVKAA